MHCYAVEGSGLSLLMSSTIVVSTTDDAKMSDELRRRECSHLVCAAPAGKKYETAKHWRIPVVSLGGYLVRWFVRAYSLCRAGLL
jgi:hypothetical protein